MISPIFSISIYEPPPPRTKICNLPLFISSRTSERRCVRGLTGTGTLGTVQLWYSTVCTVPAVYKVLPNSKHSRIIPGIICIIVDHENVFLESVTIQLVSIVRTRGWYTDSGSKMKIQQRHRISKPFDNHDVLLYRVARSERLHARVSTITSVALLL